MTEPHPNPHTQLQRRGGLRELARTLRRQRESRTRTSAPLQDGRRKANPLVAMALTLLVVAVLSLFMWPAIRLHLQAAAVLRLLANQPVPEALRWTVSNRVAVDDLELPTGAGMIRGRLYTPVEHPNAPAIILLHGVHHLGMDDPRMLSIASAMSACGLRVLTPELPDIKDYHVGASSIATIGDSAAWFSEHTGGQPVGVMGFSFSGGLSLLAAGDPQFRQAIKFVVAVGSQDEMARVATYYRTGEDQLPNGAEELLPPHEYGALVLEYEHLEDFVPQADIAPLRTVLRAHLYEDVAAEAAATRQLTPQQSGEAKILMATESVQTRALLAKAEAKHINDMAGVSPHGHLSHLTVPVYLLHGAGDNIIPAAETLWMESELPTTTLKAALISPVLSHIDVNGGYPGLLDNLRLVHFFALIMQASESK